MLEYDVLDMILRYKDKYALYEGYHGVISLEFSHTTFGYSLYRAPFQYYHRSYLMDLSST